MSCTRFAGLRTTALFSLLGALATACGSDGPAAPTTGALAISSTAQTTTDNTSFDYTITIDNGTPRTIAASTPASYVVDGLSIGTHTVSIRQLAAGCSANNDTRSITVVGGDTVDVAFAVVCARTTGDVTVNVITSGVDLDTDGYGITVDGVNAGSVTSNGNTILRALTPGSKTVGITGVASNCTAAAATKPVVVAAGLPTPVTFDVTCRPRTAVMRFNVATTGAEPDPNGYQLVIDGMGFRLPSNGVFRLLNVPLGRRFLQITEVANNCAMLFAPVQDINITVADTVVVPVNVECIAAGAGVEGFNVIDPANDTLPNPENEPDPAIDLRSTSGRYSAGWVTFTLRFAKPVLPPVLFAPNSLTGFLELDTDENATTGTRPIVNQFGGNATQGVDAVVYFDEDSTQAYILRNDRLVGSAGLRFAGDAVTMSVPLALLNDDGNMSITVAVGTFDRPTDLAPNTGVILARRPAATIANEAFPRDASRTAPTVPAMPEVSSATWRSGPIIARPRVRRWMP